MAIQYQAALDRAFHALGDGTRRQMISMLAHDGALSANQLRAPFNVAQPTISKHLKVLEAAGMVRREIVGRVHRFHLQTKTLREAEDWIAEHRTFWEGTLERLEAFVCSDDEAGGGR
ncbi:ArsR/SmtB family transcription factor [Hoeflea prorocentri]|uniref:Metalloregulator ArsR/SmtB family transcription factor n=1 Tax=Hoeflea prorocentri TaxID=1922333 RepID=A0A9X3UJS3_9HYPH|nr:metalloregulator ArsR/SmtB family transcription factor [Hoeflea prorocentri]MCY6380076.1 metalloregulator ArsR/SmtB family transcription factor [Hoeflea prorocentri]MDA5397876.1 metalloregulator ArsR/SmtB family transcription factor [Hoeflea prorocentri]